MEDLEQVMLFPDHPDWVLRIRMLMTLKVHQQLMNFLQQNAKVFAWSHKDMKGISPDVITHHLSIDPQYRPVCQKLWAYDAIRYAAMKAEVDKLRKHNFIR